ncbi:g8299 [Coccomyxa elongata]
MADLLPGGKAHDVVAGLLLLVQHPPVYTLGSGSSLNHLGFDPASPPHPLFRTERGGEVTYHGPGQLVVYPIINLRRFQPDLHWYLRSLEEVIIRALAEVSGLTGERIPGLTGVWVHGQKVAAIGVRATKWVTYHGLAINIATDLAPFLHITPCGISDRPVTSVQRLLGEQAVGLSTPDTSGRTEQQQQDAREPIEAAMLLREYVFAMKSAFADVFAAKLQEDHAHIVDSDSAEAPVSACK